MAMAMTKAIENTAIHCSDFSRGGPQRAGAGKAWRRRIAPAREVDAHHVAIAGDHIAFGKTDPRHGTHSRCLPRLLPRD
jgi:hypothetical protein